MDVIRQLREACGLTQEQLAARIGRGQSWLAMVENGYRRSISLEDGVKLAAVFGLTPAELQAAISRGALEAA